MPVRAVPLVTGEYYHVYNRGYAKQEIFLKPSYYTRFERAVNYYLPEKPSLSFSKYLRLTLNHQFSWLQQAKDAEIAQVEIIAYCLMPNHYHFLLHQHVDNGISNFMRKLGNSFTHYFNTMTKPGSGSLFQGIFKAVLIESNSQLLHLSRYIHLNPVMANLVKKDGLESYPHSSYGQYVNNTPTSTLVVCPSIVLDQFKSRATYRDFCLDHVSYGLSLASIKHALIDEP